MLANYHIGWAAALLVVTVAVALVIRHERRQARRLADRSRELELLSTELLRVNRMKSEFLANVSHELRTPLNAIVGFAELLKEGVYGDLTLRQSGPIQRIEASANHLRHLVDQILDLAKMAAGRLDIHAESMDLRPFILDVVSEVEPLFAEKKLEIKVDLDPRVPRVHTDGTHLRQILVNLLGNSAKFTNTGRVTVHTARVEAADPTIPDHVHLINDSIVASPHPWTIIQVADTGIGIDPADHTRIFEEFEQVNAGPRGDSINRGTGLGLSISRRLARLLGGDVTVISKLGQGSTFTVWLPTAELPRKESPNLR